MEATTTLVILPEAVADSVMTKDLDPSNIALNAQLHDMAHAMLWAWESSNLHHNLVAASPPVGRAVNSGVGKWLSVLRLADGTLDAVAPSSWYIDVNKQRQESQTPPTTTKKSK